MEGRGGRSERVWVRGRAIVIADLCGSFIGCVTADSMLLRPLDFGRFLLIFSDFWPKVDSFVINSPRKKGRIVTENFLSNAPACEHLLK